ncbi:hypothetical protein AHF37_11921 [Paragonimus kellicotti]|nr:hypothetical protein AHF37_11921 [Paragonimus kellicotti]
MAIRNTQYPIPPFSQGMTYLHQIPVPHGHLKSSNCLFDSRFAVKVTDFGLPRIRGPNCQKYDYGTPAYYRNLFWTAPELIPTKEGDSPAATFKADVYAYAIICQEIIYRKGPFYVEEETQPEPIDIITAVQDRQTPCYRPALQMQEEGSEEVIQMVRKAWDDDPNKRPDFRLIGKTVGYVTISVDTCKIFTVNLLASSLLPSRIRQPTETSY